jgi:glycosyltransferase involved in cell wall biosynthesis
LDAAFFYTPDRNDHTGIHYGRYAANGGLLAALAQFGSGDHIHCVTPQAEDLNTLAQLLTARGVCGKSLSRFQHFALGMQAHDVNTLLRFDPNLGETAWQRRSTTGSDASLSLCGLTHSLSALDVNRWLLDAVVAPLFDWDAIICTSRAARALVTNLMDQWQQHLLERLGGREATRHTRPMLPIIPLGVDAGSFDPGPEIESARRGQWRQRLGINEGEVMVLFFGRLSYEEKANPIPMYIALEEAARTSGARFHLVQAGRFPRPEYEALYRDAARAFMPGVPMHLVDGNDPDLSGIWSAADIFTSLSDNIQETFGLTPVEAMAAGLPSVVTDWDGYRDTIADEAGIRVPTLWPPAGDGYDIAAEHCYSGNYYRTITRLSQVTAAAVSEAAAAYGALGRDLDLRRRMGQAARQRARQQYDWPVVVAQYEGLWAEQRARRLAARALQTAPPSLPLWPDPFDSFASFPSRQVAGSDKVTRTPLWQERLGPALADPLARIHAPALEPLGDLAQVLARIPEAGATLDVVLAPLDPLQRPQARLALLWAAKLGLVSISR